MNTPTIETTDEVYAFVEQLKAEASSHGDTNFTTELDDALYLGSSGLEILGAIRKTLIAHHARIESLVGAEGQSKADQVVAFVDRAFGRQ